MQPSEPGGTIPSKRRGFHKARKRRCLPTAMLAAWHGSCCWEHRGSSKTQRPTASDRLNFHLLTLVNVCICTKHVRPLSYTLAWRGVPLSPPWVRVPHKAGGRGRGRDRCRRQCVERCSGCEHLLDDLSSAGRYSLSRLQVLSPAVGLTSENPPQWVF